VRRLELHPDRCFDPDDTVRRVARSLYESICDLPIISPHGHVDARLLADDAPFPDPAALLITPDHYLLRLLYSHGVPLEALGVAPRDGTDFERDPRRIWRRFADHYHLFRGTPSALWLDHELHDVFGVRHALDAGSADHVFDHVAERLSTPAYRPRSLFERFRIELLATTDAADDTLASHRSLRDSGWPGRVIPTFRPDALFDLAAPTWVADLTRLASVSGRGIASAAALFETLAERRRWFKAHGATATDHGVATPHTEHLESGEVERLFAKAMAGEATGADARRFQAHALMEMARCAMEDGLVMQLHAGVWRNHNQRLHGRFGWNIGGDIPTAAEFTGGLHAILNAHGNDPRFTLIVFTLDESTYARELAPLAGHYPALRLGPPWWFHDSVEGMQRFRSAVTETAGIHNTAGFNDDTRAFCSIPARHDVARRMDANWLAGLVARHRISMEDAREMAHTLTVDLVRDAYRIPPAQ